MKKVVKQPKTDGLNMTTANEAEEIQKQTLDFISKHRDVFDALMDRITFLQACGDGDGLFLLSAILGRLSNQIFENLESNGIVFMDKDAFVNLYQYIKCY